MTRPPEPPTPTIATHHGSFHADDVFGVAVLMAVFPDHQLVRTRDPARIAAADFAVDVGGEWDAARGRFDHHQRGFEAARPSGVGYASAGLVWSVYGTAYVQAFAARLGHAPNPTEIQAMVEAIDSALVQHLDRVDTGQEVGAPGLFGLSSLLAQLNSHWLEEAGLDADARARLQEERFREAMAMTRRFLDRALSKQLSQWRAGDIVRKAPRLLDGRVLYLQEGGMPWTRVVIEEMPEVLLVIYPDSDGQQYQLRTVPVSPDSFRARLDLPRPWAGLRDEALAAATGVADSVFCHLNVFIAGARSLEGAQRLAALALAAQA